MSNAALPGQRLREERERQGLDPEDISARLRLSRTYLQALEADDYARLPQPAFVRGYLRSYAKMLGLPGDELVADFERLVNDSSAGDDQRAETEPEERLDADGAPFWVWPAGAVALVIVVAVLWLAGGETPEPVADEPSTAESPEPLPDVATGREETGAEAPQAQQPVEPEPVEPVEGLSGDGRRGPEETVAARDQAAGTDTLRMRFEDQCWLEVHEQETGERIYQGNQPAGGELELGGTAPFRVTLGNAPALASLEVNDQSLELPQGRPGQVVRVTVP